MHLMLAALLTSGLWGTDRTFGPPAHGMLTIDLRSHPARASIAGYALDATLDGSAVRFALPANAGSFRGRLAGATVAGFWTQPRSVVRGVPYASPVALREGPAHVFTGEVRPLDDRLTLYLVFTQSADGTQHAFLRDPVANSGMGRPFVVHVDGAKVELANADDATDRLTGTYDPDARRLVLDSSDYGPLVFTQRAPDDAVGFYPRTPQTAAWNYRQPIAGDGWRTASLASQHVDAAPIAKLVDTILTTSTTSFKSPYVQALLIARHGRLVLEEYFYGFDRYRTHDMRSASKTIAGTILGAALEHGAPFTLQSPVESLFRYPSYAHPDPRKSRITVQDLLTMSSGFDCDDNDDNSPGNEDRMYAQSVQLDYYKYALDLPMARDPGSGTAVYCTAGMNLLGGILRNATGQPLVDLFDRYVASPLGISEYHINLSPNGDAYMGGGMYLRPRDMLKLGQVYLDGGVWNGRRVVSASWAAQSVRRHATFPASAYAPAHDYGFAWHLFSIPSVDRTYREYMAQGNGGQILAVLPDLDATVLILAGNYGNFPTWRSFFERDIPQSIVPALK